MKNKIIIELLMKEKQFSRPKVLCGAGRVIQDSLIGFPFPKMEKMH